MAYLSDTAWCDPDLADLSLPAFAIWCKALSYSSGMGTRGRLTPAQQKLIGATPKIRAELVDKGRWVANGQGVVINKWDAYNARRDEKRIQDRERKRRMRDGLSESEWASARKTVYERDRGVCADCGASGGRWHADHIPDRETLRAQGIPLTDPEHIETRCTSCHSRRTQVQRTASGQVADK